MNTREHACMPDVRDTDVLIIGSGAAGLRAALAAAAVPGIDVTLLTKSVLKESNTRYAQGGIAVAMNVDDTLALHVQDTLVAGAGLCDVSAVERLVAEGIPRVAELIDWGAAFDWEGTLPRFTQEAAHSRRRIVHKGDATGRETTDVLVQQVLNTEGIHVHTNAFALEVLTAENQCYGVLALVEGARVALRAKATILATGGLGRLYPCTSNPEVATGDGIAAAWRAGCELIDMEFVQFHPTTLFLDTAPHFLISEAVRGEGGKLITIRGERFMEKYHELGELAPRDVVSRAIHTEMHLTGFPCVYLDITHKPAEFIVERFPTIFETTHRYGLDIRKDLIPVRPGAHFMMGGIRTNTEAETNVRGLYACGEVACTGVHGANRLASNSLLECLVYGARAGTNAATFAQTETAAFPPGDSYMPETAPISAAQVDAVMRTMRETLWKNVGIERDGEGLQETVAQLQQLTSTLLCEEMQDVTTSSRPGETNITPPEMSAERLANSRKSAECLANYKKYEAANMLDVARCITEAALLRTESRGAHYRSDFPEKDDTAWHHRLILTRDKEPRLIALEG